MLLIKSTIFWTVGHVTFFLLFFNLYNTTILASTLKTVAGNLMWNYFQFIFPTRKAFIATYSCMEAQQDVNLKAFERYMFKKPGLKPKKNLVAQIWPLQTVSLQLSEI